MTAELTRGQNHPLPGTRVEIRVSAGTAVLAGAVLGDAAGRLSGSGALAHRAPGLPGVTVPGGAAARHVIAVDLSELPDEVHRVGVLLALVPGAGPVSFGAAAAPFLAVTEPTGVELATYTVTGLGAETALIALELYRRQDAWKVRAVGQGYAGGLAALLADHGLPAPEAAELAAGVHAEAGPVRTTATATATDPVPPVPSDAPGPPAGTAASAAEPAVGGSGIDYAHPRRARTTPPPPVPRAPEPAEGEAPRPVAGDATGWTLEERLYNQVWGMFEDLARAVAAYRNAVEFADSRLERELDQTLTDPRARLGGAADSARDTAQARREELVAQARAVLDRDLAQLVAESQVVEPALPPAFARWDAPQWQGAEQPDECPMALRLGDLHLPESPELRIPMLVRLPLERGLWIDCGRTGSEAAMAMDTDDLRRVAMDTAVALAIRVLASHPAGEFRVHAIDPAGAAAASLAPLSGLLAEAPAAGAAGVSELLASLTRRVDLVQMALKAGAPEDLPPDLDTARRLVIVHDFPHGFDERAVTRLRYLADEGPQVGVHLLMVADRDEASAYGPLLDPLWRSLLRLSPVPDDHLADPWVGHAWTYEPLHLAPWEAQQVLARITVR
ncbi:TerD family protein [Streptomyces sp. NPDC086023]|uniref:TerD family protein n=1 Tax=Streptomyces sp. NPDC086023 TaxID=3365746 RepID=UPI0037D01D8A